MTKILLKVKKNYLFKGITVCTALLSAFDDAIMLWCCTFFYGLSLRSEILNLSKRKIKKMNTVFSDSRFLSKHTILSQYY